MFIIKKYLNPELEQLFTETKRSRELLCKRERDKNFIRLFKVKI